MLCAAIIVHWLVALAGFLIISSVSGIVNVMPYAHNLHILGSMEGIIIAQWAQCSPD